LPQREFPASPLVGVGAVIFDELGRVLLIQRGTEPNKGRWSIPGGLVELGEPLQEALRREVLEETGLSVEPKAVVDVVDRIYTEQDGDVTRIRFHYVVIDYWCRRLDGVAKFSSDAAAICWASASEWRENYALEPITIEVIDKGWAMAQGLATNA
jgi:ADP-ribose pyrophosphatase YjhB (NUDIX family)